MISNSNQRYMPILFVFVRRLYLRRGRVHWCYAQPWEEEADEAQALHIHITFRITDYGLLLCKLFSTEDCPTILGPLNGCNILFNRARGAYSAILSCQSVCIFNYFCANICIVLYRYNYVCVLAEHSINKYQQISTKQISDALLDIILRSKRMHFKYGKPS